MNNRQKSFFEQEHRGKAKPHWNGNRNFDAGRNQEHTLPKPALPKPPIAPSSQSRTKLHAFQFDRNQSASPEKAQEKENEPDWRHEDVDPVKKNASPGKAEADGLLPPSTPAMRLPLADLIGNAEDALRRPAIKEDSPEEQLGWIPNSSNSALTPGQRRKRAHSSSPCASSQNEISNHFAMREPLDLQHMQQSLRTPHADPAADLWNRYAVSRNSDDAPSGVHIPSFAHLLNDSSPHALPRTPGGSVGGLRRWASCGMEWPTSKAKKRRTNPVFRDQPEDVLESRESAKQHLAKVSRVGMLVEQMQATLAQPYDKHRRDGPSSSSPLPEKGVFGDGPVISPTNRGRRPDQPRDTEHHDARGDHSQAYRSQHSQRNADDDNVLPAESASQNLTTAQSHSTRLEPIEEDFGDVDFDEFEDDMDITAEDLEFAVPLFVAQPSQNKRQKLSPEPRPTPPQISAQLQPDPKSISSLKQEPYTTHDDEDDDYGDLDVDEDEFGDLEVDEDSFAAAEVAATQAYHASTATQGPLVKKKSRAIQRYLVKEVTVGKYRTDHGFEMDEKTLFVQDQSLKAAKTIVLRQTWIDTHCMPGAYVHVVGLFSTTGRIVIDDAHNLVIVHPDHLVSATAVADSFDCLRKAVLQDRIKATSQTSKPTVYGTILHEVFQVAMRQNKWSSDYLDQLVEQTVVSYVEGLFEAGAQNTNEAFEDLKAKMPELQSWATAFVSAVPTALAEDRNGKKIRLGVSKLLDVEEHVWSPTYGLKGNIDATVEVVMEDDQGTRTLTVPFEVKTGKYQSAAHRAQTALYTLLLSDRYDIDIVYGILYYMDTSAVSRIPAIRNELRHMVMQRNELASYVRERLQLPPMLQNAFKCGRCYAKTSCFLYHKLSENGTTESAGVKEKFNEVVSKLRPVHQDFFKKWDELLTKEESEMFKFRRELWTMLSPEREKLGRCFSEVIIEAGSAKELPEAQKINRFAYTFVKQNSKPGFSFTESQIVVGEPIVISSEQGHFALANGYVTKVSARRISVAVDRRLHNARRRRKDFDEANHQAFYGIMEVGQEGPPPAADDEEPTVYRLDKDEFSNGMATVRNNLLAIMDDSTFRSHELRQLLVEGRPPVFTPMPTAYSLGSTGSQIQINSDQHAAIEKIMSAKDYALVLGMPGTGKTTTIAHIIRALVARGKSVLLTSYTHTAVDNILLKLKQSDISVLRLGVLAKVHPEVQEFANLAAIPRHSIEELEEMYMTPQVVATTCLGISHQLFHKRAFDYCIVDEASQITLPVCLGPIRMAQTFVLVGDHYQLPPLVQNKEAQEGGLDVSLFKLLSDQHPDSVVSLEHQYRMCKEVMLLSNTLIYSGRLKCGNEAVANRTLHVPNPDGLYRYHFDDSQPASSTPRSGKCRGPGPTCWVSDVISPQRKVVFINTDTLSPRPLEVSSGARITNETEVALTAQTVLGLIAQGIAPSEIGVITFYRSQLALMKQSLKYTEAEGVEMHTADKFQGRDKEVVLVSCVRSNETGNVGDLLKDWRRINVAFTRARSKLVVLGSAETLGKNELLAQFLKITKDQGWKVDLPPQALDMHSFESEMQAALTTQKTPAKSPQKQPLRRLEGRTEARAVLSDDLDLSNRGPRRVGLKKPNKVAKIGAEALLKSKPVLQDIVNDILGDGGVA